MAEFVLFSNSHCKTVDSQFEALMEAQVKGQVQDILEAWVEKLSATTEIQLAAIAGSWAIYGLALNWSHAKKPPPAESFADNILQIINATLGLPNPESKQ